MGYGRLRPGEIDLGILLNVTIEDDAANETFDVFVVLTHSVTGELKYITTQKASINQSNWNATHYVFDGG